MISIFKTKIKPRLIVFIALLLFLAAAASAQQGDTISLNVKGMDIVDVLKIFSARSNMNIVIGRNVTGRVTLFLKEVDVRDAFEIILLANDLACREDDKIINVMTKRDYEQAYGKPYQDIKEIKIIQLKHAGASALAGPLNQIKTSIGKVIPNEISNTIVLIDIPENLEAMEEFAQRSDLPLETEVFSLNYAQAEQVAPKIQEVLTKGVGSLKSDERTNKIIATDYPEKLNQIRQIVNALDEKTPQVLIDAQIVEVRPSDKFEMGVDWDYWIKKYFRVANSFTLDTSIDKTSAVANKIVLGTSSDDPCGRGDYKAAVSLLQTIGDTKILSSPRIMVLNNQEARILVGTKEAYITSSTSQAGESTITSQSVNFVDVGIKLYVTPNINRDGFITMKIRPEISSAEADKIISEDKITEIPIVTTSETETTVMVKNGVTVIMGGLKKDQHSETIKKVPVIGNIPLLGALFKNTVRETSTTELVILLTPHIVSGEEALTQLKKVTPVNGAVSELLNGEIITKEFFPAENRKADNIELLTAKNKDDYYRIIARKINAAAEQNPAGNKTGEVEIKFSLASNGELLQEPAVLKATDPSLSPFALKAVKDAAAFPPFPEEISKETEAFRITLSY